MEKSMDHLVRKVLTETKAPATKASDTIFQRFKKLAAYETKGSKSLDDALEATAKFAASLNFTQPYWLTISGKSGTGKTHLAKAVRRQFLEQNRFEHKADHEHNRIVGNTEWYCDWRQFADNIRSGGYERLVEDACSEWFVIIDDFGAERDPTGFIASAADRILNSRRDKWTLITTNLTLTEIGDRMDARIASRLIRDNNEVVEIAAQDYAMRDK